MTAYVEIKKKIIIITSHWGLLTLCVCVDSTTVSHVQSRTPIQKFVVSKIFLSL